MPQPVATVMLGSSDISAEVNAPEGQASAKWGRGANFDGSSEAPGYAVLVVRNEDRAFNPLNGSSPYAANLKLNKLVRITATYSAVTYYLFHGFVRRIVQREDGFAEIHAQDAMSRFSKLETSVVGSASRSVSAFRGLILDNIGETSGNRNLALGSGPEAAIPFTGADQHNALGLLSTLNADTGTLHFIKPDAAAYDYTTMDRLAFQSAASVDTWTDADLTTPFATSLAFFDYTDEAIINSQRATAQPRLLADRATLWSAEEVITVNASTTQTIWATFNDPTLDLVVVSTATGSPTVTLTPFSRSAKIDITAGASAATLTYLAVTGRAAAVQNIRSALVEDATSITAYGRLLGSDIDGDYIPSRAWAEGLASYKIWRYKDPRAEPGVTFANRFPTQLARDVGEVVTLTSTELSLSAARMCIRSFETVISAHGAQWTTTYRLEEAPAVLDLFTVGGTAAQGVGGSGTLGY